jgi:hypothetical protein
MATRIAKPTPQSEEVDQINLIQWARLQPRLQLLHAIPNGGARSKATAGRLKAAGVLAGMPDLHLPGRFYVEMKRSDLAGRKNGGLTDSQLEVFRPLSRITPIFICYGFWPAYHLLNTYVKQGPWKLGLDDAPIQCVRAEQFGPAEFSDENVHWGWLA